MVGNEIDATKMQTVVQDFGALIQTVQPGTYYDVSMLPHSKDTILKSLLYALKVTDDAQLREHIKTGLVFLSQFQEGVGPSPISPVPIDVTDLARQVDAGELDVDAAAEKVAEAAKGVDEEKIKQLETLCQVECERFLALAASIESERR
jgi:hypothetical protein